MRNTAILIFLLGFISLNGLGCATKKCIEALSALDTAQVIRGDGQLLTRAVERRRQAAEALRALSEGSSDRSDTIWSVQAWEMAIRLITQLQNLSRSEEEAGALEEQRELITQIRCLAKKWVSDDDFIVSARSGQRMLEYQRQIEETFGNRGRPSDSELSAICEGEDIYMGPVEEEVDVPDTDTGTGPDGEIEPEESEEPAEEEEGSEDDALSAVDELLGE